MFVKLLLVLIIVIVINYIISYRIVSGFNRHRMNSIKIINDSKLINYKLNINDDKFEEKRYRIVEKNVLTKETKYSKLMSHIKLIKKFNEITESVCPNNNMFWIIDQNNDYVNIKLIKNK